MQVCRKSLSYWTITIRCANSETHNQLLRTEVLPGERRIPANGRRRLTPSFAAVPRSVTEAIGIAEQYSRGDTLFMHQRRRITHNERTGDQHRRVVERLR